MCDINLTNPKIIIVGAGPAGIACAAKLAESGFTDFTILEAENRIGGRVYSVDDSDEGILDLGAQWVHGEKGNVVYQMAKESLRKSHNDYTDFTYFMSSGSSADKKTTDRLFSIANDILEDEKLALDNCPSSSLEEYFLKFFTDRVLKEFEKDSEALKLAKYFENWIHKFISGVESFSNWNLVSVKGYFNSKLCDGYQYWNWGTSGYKSIFDILMPKDKSLIDKILLNKEVKEIIWKDMLTIICSDNSKYSADHIILTVSIGVLQKFQLFTPALPPNKIKVMDKISMGVTNKVFLKFPKKWWPDDLKGFSLLWTDEDRQNLITEFPHGPQIDGNSWLEDIYGFYVVDGFPTILLGWITGAMSKDVELLEDEIVLKGCMFVLKKFLKSNFDIPEPTKMIRSKWHSNPHFCGSYSYPSFSQNDGDIEDFAEPVCNDKGKEVVLFAGEATSSKNHSTVHGAVESGFREAERLINLYKKPPIHKKVIIIGAGMAGLGAASKLQESNEKDFLILEAQDYIGGRIKSIEIEGKTLDLGAQWLHGTQNPLYEIAKKYNLLKEETSVEGEGIYIRNDGKIIDDFLVKKVDFKIGEILQECEKFQHCHENYPESVGKYLKEQFQIYLDKNDDDEETKILKWELFEWHKVFQIIDNSCVDLSRLSAKQWGKYVCLDDVAHFNLKNGYKSLIDTILDHFVPKEKILLNHAVSKIDSTAKQTVKLLTANGLTFTCDHLILTASLGCLKSFRNIFPPFPRNVNESIQHLGYFAIGKIFLIFERKWWQREEAFQFVWKANTPLTKENEWFKCIQGFQSVLDFPNCLIGWVGGPAVEVVENLTDNQIADACCELFTMFLPNYSNIPRAKHVVRSKWLTNKWVKGSYCHITPECDAFDCGIESLIEPVVVDHGIPRILLAGEAVHSSHYSTTHGAFESGQHQAQVLCQFFQ